MSLLISSVFTYDEDAGNYIQAVEAADGQALEPATRKAINNFVLGCKADGIWTAIKASCILAGARTRLGALTPLVGTAPTSFNFVDGDYNRKTGLVGDGSTKYLNSNRASNADPQNNNHCAAFLSVTPTLSGALFSTTGTSGIDLGTTVFIYNSPNNRIDTQNKSSTVSSTTETLGAGLKGMARSNSASYLLRSNGANTTISVASDGAGAGFPSIEIYRRNINGSFGLWLNGRLAFYSIGESLDLARLDSRVTDLINAFAVTIP